jgi:hypothetical protein
METTVGKSVRILLIIPLILFASHSLFAGGTLADMLLPETTIGDVSVTDRELIVTRQGMYDYMDGGAELYFNHGWQVLIAADLSGQKDREFKIELYRVATHQNALDLLQTQVDLGDTVQVGEKSYYGSGMIVWIQGNYYIRLWTWDEYDNVKEDLTQIANILVKQLDSIN